MSVRTVATQSEFDQAVRDGVDRININSTNGVWIEVSACNLSTIRAFGSFEVSACNLSTVIACGSSTVIAYGSSTIRAWDSSTVIATSRVAVHLHSGLAHVAGGVLIDHTQEPGDAEGWCRYHDVEVIDGIATVYKAVNDEWTTSLGASYAPGSTPSAPDWNARPECGHGLHFSPTPIEAMRYHPEATRFVAVGVWVDELVPILGDTPKCKAPRVVVPCREVTIDMDNVDKDA